MMKNQKDNINNIIGLLGQVDDHTIDVINKYLNNAISQHKLETKKNERKQEIDNLIAEFVRDYGTYSYYNDNYQINIKSW